LVSLTDRSRIVTVGKHFCYPTDLELENPMNAAQAQLVTDFENLVADATQKLADFDSVVCITAWPYLVKHKTFFVSRDGDTLRLTASADKASHWTPDGAREVAKLFGGDARPIGHRDALVETLAETQSCLDTLNRELAA
jgi:hypothetical protein